ncbi:hypothetical protein LWI28_022229 [Acer negundo]|uniref:Ubiquitin-like protease family profile domain-containing protein n=1 Tax=Acer negundo TaxID=4023 RepID=A0AAD5P173_ACENE|nr:hypothetical protein LWI28_022229 [Acer negundo]
MLHQVEFHSNRTKDDVTYSLSKKGFRMSIMDGSRGVPQQHQGGNCGAYTLRLAEYLLANKKEFDWKEEDMGTIREKMAVEEVFLNLSKQAIEGLHDVLTTEIESPVSLDMGRKLKGKVSSSRSGNKMDTASDPGRRRESGDIGLEKVVKEMQNLVWFLF